MFLRYNEILRFTTVSSGDMKWKDSYSTETVSSIDTSGTLYAWLKS